MTAKDRNAARDQPCQIRIPGCLPGNETVVLCHYSLMGISGKGLKSPDWLGSWGCAHCHAVCDGREPRPAGWTRNDVRLAFAEGCFRTHYAREAA